MQFSLGVVCDIQQLQSFHQFFHASKLLSSLFCPLNLTKHVGLNGDQINDLIFHFVTIYTVNILRCCCCCQHLHDINIIVPLLPTNAIIND